MTNSTDLQALQKEYEKTHITTYEIITPEIAQNFLDCNLNECTLRNRSINKRNLAKLSRDIKNKKWKPDASSIKFDTLGRMIDGQHTCRAIINADEEVLCKVERGCDPDSFMVLDSGKPRTHTDVLTTLVLPNGKLVDRPKVLAGAIVILTNLRKNHIHVDKNYTLTNTEICDIVNVNWKYYTTPLDKITKWYSNLGKRVPETWLAAFYYDKKKVYNLQVDVFMNILCNNDTMSPLVRSFREELAANKTRSDLDKKKMTPYVIFQKMGFLFKYHLDGTLSIMRYFKKSDLVKIS